MAWMPVDQHLTSHEKTLKLAKALRIHRYEAAGLLLEVWGWAIDHAKDGHVSPETDTASFTNLLGTRSDRARNVLASLKECGWIDENDRLHEWDEWGGKIVRERERDARKKRMLREHFRGDHPMFTEGCPKCVRGMSGGRGPTPLIQRPGDRPQDRPQDVARRPVDSPRDVPPVDKTRVDTPNPSGIQDATGEDQ